MSGELKDYAIYVEIGKATWEKLPYLTVFKVSVCNCGHSSLISRV